MKYDSGVGRKASPLPQETVLRETIDGILNGLGLRLIEFSVSRHKGSIQVRVVIYKPDTIGHEDCTRAHRAVKPCLDLAFQGQEVLLEVSSPGISRSIKDGKELSNYAGREVTCYRLDISDWSSGILEKADEEGVVLRSGKENLALKYEVIAKARLN